MQQHNHLKNILKKKTDCRGIRIVWYWDRRRNGTGVWYREISAVSVMFIFLKTFLKIWTKKRAKQ